MSLSLDRRTFLAGLGAAAGLPAVARADASAWDALLARARTRARLPYADGVPVGAFRAGEAVFLAGEFRAPGDPGRFGAAAAIFAVATFLPLQGGGRDGEAVRVGVSDAEEDPLSARFGSPVSPLQGERGTAFGLFGERPVFRELTRAGDTLLALLDCPSIAAAARLRLADGGRAMRIEAQLFFRAPVEGLALAPCSALVEAPGIAAVREAEALAISTRDGGSMRRLANPDRPSLSRFPAAGVERFGLAVPAGTAPIGARPPSLIVTPSHDWGDGDIALAEQPAGGEFHDNVAAAFVPRRTFAAGDAFAYRYALAWSVAEPARIA